MAVNVVQNALSSRRVNRWLPWVAGAVLAAGVIAFLVAYFGNTANSKETFGKGKPQTFTPTRNVPLERGARVVAGKFILTAVQRRHLDQAWPIVTNQLKGGISYRDWLKGEIPVVPFNAPIWKAPMKVDYSHPREAQLEVILVPRANKNKIQSTLFIMIVKKVGDGKRARWLVDYWEPQANLPLPVPN
jgi:hypothetical protein